MKARYVTTRRVAALGATLAERDRAVLATLARVRVATARQLARLHCADISPRQGRAALASLAERQLLARLDRVIGGARAGSAGYVYTLGPAGVRLGDPTRRTRRPWEVGASFLAHSLAVTQVYAELSLAAGTGAFRLVAFDGEPACWRGFFGSGGERVTLKPDAYAVLRIGPYTDHWFIEMDMGTESRTTLARKAEAYRRYWMSSTEQARTGVFPRVLFVVQDDARREVMTDVLSRQPAEAWQLFLVARADEAVSRLVQGAQV